MSEQLAVLVCKPCPRCGKAAEIVVLKSEYDQYVKGVYVQNAFPNLSPDKREQILTGWCGPCWDAEFLMEDE